MNNNNKQTNILRHNSEINFNKYSSDDKLHHFGLSKKSDDLKGIFGDFVCMGGSAVRLKMFAEIFSQNIGYSISDNLSKSDRFSMWKTGPVIWVNHGMGVPSLSIMLIETIKLLHHAKASDYSFIRLGTSGGVDVAPGTLIISIGAVNGLFEHKHIQYINGKEVKRDAILDLNLSSNLFETAKNLKLPVEKGLTLCADDFYEGQMRLDGLFSEYTTSEQFEFLRKLSEIGVKNIEMESTGFAAFTYRAGIPASIMCVTLMNRLKDDQVNIDKSTYHEFEMRPFRVISAFLENCLKNKQQIKDGIK